MGAVIDIQTTQRFEEQECWGCGVLFAITSNTVYFKKRDSATLFCPNGCKLSLGESEESKLRKQLADKERQLEAERQRAATNFAAREKAEKKLKKIERRTSGGVCPCCNRTFSVLTRHMATKHPDFVAESK